MLDQIVFKNKKFSDLLEEIYINQNKKSKQITTLINELKPLISDVGDATLLIPLLKDYLDVGVKNDEQLIKLASIVQKLNQSKNSDDPSDGILTDEEKKQILDLAKNVK